MHLTNHTDYSLRLLIYLQVFQGEPVSVRQVADAYGISTHHLAKVAQRLTQLGWISGQRGRGGGLRLEEGTGQLTLGQVVRTLEPPGSLVECHGTHSDCPIEPACRLKSALADAQEAFYQALDRHTLADIARNPKQLYQLLA